MPQAQANTISLEYESFGDASAPTILLIMGLSSQLTAWPVPFCTGLADKGFHVVRYDNRDAGLSTRFDGVRVPAPLGAIAKQPEKYRDQIPYTLDDMARDAVGLLDALNVERAHVVGASMGGMIAQLVAADHPHRVRSLTSIMSTSGDPALPQTDEEVVAHMFRGHPRSARIEDVVDYHVRTLRLIGSPDYPVRDEVLRERVRQDLQRAYYPQGFVRQRAAILACGSRVDALKRIDTPTLVIHGAADRLVPVSGGEDTARHIAGARLEIIGGMGHDLPVRLIPRFVELIAAHAQAATA